MELSVRSLIELRRYGENHHQKERSGLDTSDRAGMSERGSRPRAKGLDAGCVEPSLYRVVGQLESFGRMDHG